MGARRSFRFEGGPPLLCVVIDAAAFGDDASARARALFRAGADWLQLRDRWVSDAQLLAVARALVEARATVEAEVGARADRLRVVVNKRADVARAGGADGAHLGFDALDVPKARALLGPGAVLGRSLHSVDEVRAASALDERPDYVHLAPIWNPNSKPAERPALGPHALAEAAATGLPVFAQGGLDIERTPEAVAAGATGIAVTGALARGADPESFLPPLRHRLDEFA